MSYELVEDGKAIKCLVCGRVSFNPNDVAQKYCGFCHRFHEDLAPAGASEADLAELIERNAASIYVREEIDGKWGNYSLVELPARLAIRHALRLYREGRARRPGAPRPFQTL